MWLFIDHLEPEMLEKEYAANKAFSIVEYGTLIASNDRDKLIEDLPFTEDKEDIVYVEIPKDI